MLGTGVHSKERELRLPQLQRSLAQQPMVEVGWGEVAACGFNVTHHETERRSPV